jgi:hypothetical protein
LARFEPILSERQSGQLGIRQDNPLAKVNGPLDCGQDPVVKIREKRVVRRQGPDQPDTADAGGRLFQDPEQELKFRPAAGILDSLKFIQDRYSNSVQETGFPDGEVLELLMDQYRYVVIAALKGRKMSGELAGRKAHPQSIGGIAVTEELILLTGQGFERD